MWRLFVNLKIMVLFGHIFMLISLLAFLAVVLYECVRPYMGYPLILFLPSGRREYM